MNDFLAAVQFLTRVPVPGLRYREDSLAGALKYFPLVGALIGGAAAGLNLLLMRHLPRLAAAIVVVVFLLLITGCLHEDGLADAADGFGGGRSREKILLILRDSRIGSYGAAALCLSLMARVVLIASLPMGLVAQYLVVASMLCRWTVLPLSYFLPSAREEDGQGARIARGIGKGALMGGTLFAFVVAGWLLRWEAIAPVVAAGLVAGLSGWFYRRKIGGVTGDCFGATAQISEVAIYLCGVWVR